jgi:hypothetical protein
VCWKHKYVCVFNMERRNCSHLYSVHFCYFCSDRTSRYRLSRYHHGVAAQVAFERHVLKPVFHLIGARVETRRISDMGSYGSGGVNVHRPPHHGSSLTRVYPSPSLQRYKLNSKGKL